MQCNRKREARPKGRRESFLSRSQAPLGNGNSRSSASPIAALEAELPELRSQAELGNEIVSTGTRPESHSTARCRLSPAPEMPCGRREGDDVADFSAG